MEGLGRSWGLVKSRIGTELSWGSWAEGKRSTEHKRGTAAEALGAGCVFTRLLRNSGTETLFPRNPHSPSSRSSGDCSHLRTSARPAHFQLFKAVCSLCWPFRHMTLSRSPEVEEAGPPTKAQLGDQGEGCMSPKKRRGTLAEDASAEW